MAGSLRRRVKMVRCAFIAPPSPSSKKARRSKSAIGRLQISRTNPRHCFSGLKQNGKPGMAQKTWGGRFSAATDNRVEAFTESISFDQRLYKHDILASQAHACMLAEVGLLTADEATRIVAALDEIRGEIERGEFGFSVQ